MKISLEWLKDYIDLNISPEEIGDILSDLGFPLEEMISFGDDTVLDIEVTSNRGDCLSYMGVARELSVATGSPLKLPEVSLKELDSEVGRHLAVNINETELCKRYTARYIEGVEVGPSPEWMVRRLEASGLRSVNNVVDATNYAMLECGQPPHAFDYDKLSGDTINVRKAISGEKLTSIDHSVCELKPDQLVIADEENPVAIAGVMGGFETEVSQTTTKILLEEAFFDPVSVRTTARRLGLGSEASFRFERNIDIRSIEWASRRCAQLITSVAGGAAAKGIADSCAELEDIPEITLRPARLSQILGFDVPEKKVFSILEDLGFNPQADKKSGELKCKSPTWRNDITREIDLIEEIARVYGYNKIPVEDKITIRAAKADPRQKCMQQVGTYLNACGYFETLGITFTDPQNAKLFTGRSKKEYMAVKDVSRKNSNLLRQTLAGSLAEVMKNNKNFGNAGCKFYEIADTYELDGSELNEKTKLAFIAEAEIRELRGIVEGLVRRYSKTASVQVRPASVCWAEPGGEVFINSESVGICGRLSKSVCDKIGLKDTKPAMLEIDFDKIYSLMGEQFKVARLQKFPSVERDISLIVSEELRWLDIERVIEENAPEQLEQYDYVDTYRGKPIPSGRKSLTMQLVFRDDDGTLTHEQVDEFEKPLIKALTNNFNAELRTS
ncbi:phenylalanine--tRNA ligase subunit beta [Sedimentisphaera salicampi]|uniref:Phenylalanine--tRNA ligase beta subunit n=1 Tax=Sedimentisphaera salicampi TaxID=1941349 RepID=A0A1W6LP64_9BACT|nr:phenylalanine--tRNA ligase subunit beta [Sedimentisphaera salicampi]ARN57570.1 Phenylalanine--tRNA ligase beta subunit [Sedimentisphaera salicampi]